MTVSIDSGEWTKFWVDTPFHPGKAPSPNAAMKLPGCCVKSRAPQIVPGGGPGPLKQQYGRLAYFTDNLGEEIVVIGHASPISPVFTWKGSLREYFATWECD